ATRVAALSISWGVGSAGMRKRYVLPQHGASGITPDHCQEEMNHFVSLVFLSSLSMFSAFAEKPYRSVRLATGQQREFAIEGADSFVKHTIGGYQRQVVQPRSCQIQAVLKRMFAFDR